MANPDKYYVTYGKQRTPKILSKDGYDFFLSGTYNLNESDISGIWKVPSNFSAEQARTLIKKEDQQAKMVYNKKKVVNPPKPLTQELKDIEKQYSSSCHFISIYDDKNQEYNYHGDERNLRKRIGGGTESIETYNINTLKNPIIRVFGRDDSSSSCIVKKGKIYLEKKL